MDAIEKLRAKGMNDVAAEFMRNRNELIVARRSLLVSHQINEEYRTKLEALTGKEASINEEDQDGKRLVERCAELTRALEALTAQHGELQDKLAQSNRSLMLAMRTAQEEADARARSEQEKAQLKHEFEVAVVQKTALQERIDLLMNASSVESDDAATGSPEATTIEDHDQSADEHTQAARAMIQALEQRIEDQRQALEETAALRSENEALKRQLETLEQQHAARLVHDDNAESERNSTIEQIRRLEAEKDAFAQQANMSRHAMITLQADLERGREALSQAQQAQAQGLSRNAELAETIRQLHVEKNALELRLVESEARLHKTFESESGAPDPQPVNSAIQRSNASPDEDVEAHECARRRALGLLFEETIFRNVLPDATQTQQIRVLLSDTGGRKALFRLIEIEKARMTRKILRSLAEEDAPE